ncbi:hypothetical protein [Mariniphaga sp.]|uniref:hypothetical protein n=1 Tax=Mariniphaga sp. TaxID=1954475 RepID=UPI00356B172C
MESNTKDALIRWIKGTAPESAHPYDMKRFYNVVYECLKNGENIDSDELAEIIRENLNWNEKQVLDFSEVTVITIEKIMKFIDFLKSEKQINIYNFLN